MNARPLLRIKEAADACQVSVKTIRRRLDGDKFPNAHRDGDNGPWLIPIGDLIGAGLTPGKPSQSDNPTQQAIQNSKTTQSVPPVDDELEKLRKQNVDLQRRAEVAEAIATERGAALDDARLALRALTQGDNAKAPPPPEQPETSTATPLRSSERPETDPDQGHSPPNNDAPRPGILRRFMQELREGFAGKE